jgi:hypothetical protein
MSISDFDSPQIIQKVYDNSGQALKVKGIGATLVTESYDYIALTNSVISGTTVPVTIVYKTGGASGTVVATLTLTYDGSANLLTVTKV